MKVRPLLPVKKLFVFTDIRSRKSVLSKPGHSGQVHTIQLVSNHLFTLGADGMVSSYYKLQSLFTFLQNNKIHSNLPNAFLVMSTSKVRFSSTYNNIEFYSDIELNRNFNNALQ